MVHLEYYDEERAQWRPTQIRPGNLKRKWRYMASAGAAASAVFANSYCGPGNLVMPASSEVNALCKQHDEKYGEWERAGKKPKWCSNSADAVLEVGAHEAGGLSGFVVSNAMRLKRKYQPICDWDIGYDKIRQTNKVASQHYRIPKRYMRRYVRRRPFKRRPRFKRRTSKFRKRRFSKRSGKYIKYRGRSSGFRKKSGRRMRSMSLINSVQKKLYPKKQFLFRIYCGIANGDHTAPSTPTTGRTVTYGRFMWKNPDVMHAMLAGTGTTGAADYTSNLRQRTFISSYVEKHTLQNPLNFPVCVTVYEFYYATTFQVPLYPASAPYTTWVSTFPDTIANENAAAALGNAFSEVDFMVLPQDLASHSNLYAAPIWTIMKENILRGFTLNGETQLGDDDRTNFSYNQYGTAAGYMAGFTRVHGYTTFKLGYTAGKQIKLRKKKVVTLGPGQQFSISYIRKNQYLNADDENQTTANNAVINKGAGGLIFHLSGYMSHDSNVNATGLQKIARSSVAMNHELKATLSYRNVPFDAQNRATWAAIVMPRGGAMTAEKRTGIVVGEYGPE